MKTHEEFLKFNNTDLIFTNRDGIDYIALKPILDGLGLVADSILKRTRRDRFLGGYTAVLSIQVGEKGKKQRRPMVCLPEKYIYGWIGHINGHTKELAEYKETCYELLYNHFKGTIGNIKAVVTEKKLVERRIKEIKNTLREDDPIQKELLSLQLRAKQLQRKTNIILDKMTHEDELFPEENT